MLTLKLDTQIDYKPSVAERPLIVFPSPKSEPNLPGATEFPKEPDVGAVVPVPAADLAFSPHS